MLDKASRRRLARLLKPYRITSGKRFRLGDMDPGDTGGLGSERKPEAMELLAQGVQWLAEEQNKLYAANRWSMLLMFQGMDAAGKDSTIRHVMSGLNPQGCQVRSFKHPSATELDHDFLWRYIVGLPERGRIGIFNRSYYEEVLVVRVHPEFLVAQNIPEVLVTKDIWAKRLDYIRGFEDYLTHNGTVVLKFFLHLSREEQKRRFLERLEQPEKHWKFSSADVAEREHWDRYMIAYEEAIRATASEHAPWYVVPADHKWFTRLVVAAAIVDAMDRLKLSYPRLSAAQRQMLLAARERLLAE